MSNDFIKDINDLIFKYGNDCELFVLNLSDANVDIYNYNQILDYVNEKHLIGKTKYQIVPNIIKREEKFFIPIEQPIKLTYCDEKDNVEIISVGSILELWQNLIDTIIAQIDHKRMIGEINEDYICVFKNKNDAVQFLNKELQETQEKFKILQELPVELLNEEVEEKLHLYLHLIKNIHQINDNINSNFY